MRSLGERQPAWRGSRAALVLACAALVCAACALLAGPGYRLGWWGMGAGIRGVVWSGGLAALCLLLALLGALRAWHRRLGPRPGRWLLAALASACTALPVAYFGYRAQTLPRIHDISTDLDQPPAFVAVLPLRQGAKNPAQYDPAVAALQRQGYPDIAPIGLAEPPAQAFARVLQAAQSMGWDIVAAEPASLRLEATATTLLFGFKDDIVIRVSPAAGGSTVDVRSLSRVGVSDVGTNAARIRAFRNRLLAP